VTWRTQRNVRWSVALCALLIVPGVGSAQNDDGYIDYWDDEYNADVHDGLVSVGRLRLAMGVNSVAAGDFDEGIFELSGAIDNFERAEEVMYIIEDDDWDDYPELSVRPDEQAKAHFSRAVAYLAKGNVEGGCSDAALSHFYRQGAGALAILTNCQIHRGDRSEAIRHYRSLTEKFPEQKVLAQEVRDYYFKVFGERIPE